MNVEGCFIFLFLLFGSNFMFPLPYLQSVSERNCYCLQYNTCSLEPPRPIWCLRKIMGHFAQKGSMISKYSVLWRKSRLCLLRTLTQDSSHKWRTRAVATWDKIRVKHSIVTVVGWKPTFPSTRLQIFDLPPLYYQKWKQWLGLHFNIRHIVSLTTNY